MKALASALLFLALPLTAQVKHRVDPLEKALEDCLGTAENQTTAGMVDCYGKAHAAADKEMNRLWLRLMKTLSPAEQSALRESQRAWMKFRDEEVKALGLLAGRAGTLHRLQAASAHLMLTRERMDQLSRFFEEGE